MSGTFTDTADRAVLSWLAGEPLPSGWVAPTDTYLALLTADPRVLPIPPGGDTPEYTNDPGIDDFSEVSATGYSRQLVVWAPAQTATGNPSSIANSAQITFGPFTDSAGMGSATTHGALVTVNSGTAGNVIMVWQWDNPVAAGQNESIIVPAGALTMTLQ
jgi:hypothetical protein